LLIFLSIILIVFFFYGFFTFENSAGAGGYDGDLKKIWNNLELYKTGVLSNLSSLEYDDSRTPLYYIIHVIINPFIDTIDEFRFSVFFISLLIPFIFFFCLKYKFNKSDNNLLILVSLLITLSPYFRTSSYWGLGENYALISILISYFLFEKYKTLIINSDKFFRNTIIFLLALFSSLIIYFDQKLLIFPLIIYFHLLILNVSNNDKIFITILYFIFSIPFIYLIFEWNSILPPLASKDRMVGETIEIFNIGYCCSIIAFYLFPFIFLKNINFTDLNKKLINKKFIILISLIFLYFFLLIFFGDFQNLPNLGKGILHKSLLLLINDYNYRFVFTLLGFLLSFLIIYIYIDNFFDGIFILYFLTISLFIYPFLQEYIDPIFLLLILTYFKTKIFITKKNTLFLLTYFFIFLIGTQIFYYA